MPKMDTAAFRKWAWRSFFLSRHSRRSGGLFGGHLDPNASIPIPARCSAIISPAAWPAATMTPPRRPTLFARAGRGSEQRDDPRAGLPARNRVGPLGSRHRACARPRQDRAVSTASRSSSWAARPSSRANTRKPTSISPPPGKVRSPISPRRWPAPGCSKQPASPTRPWPRSTSLSDADWAQFYQRYHRGLIADLAGKHDLAPTAFAQAFKKNPGTLRVAEAYARHAVNFNNRKLARADAEDPHRQIGGPSPFRGAARRHRERQNAAFARDLADRRSGRGVLRHRRCARGRRRARHGHHLPAIRPLS